uniref:HPS3 biogenesis of lysosomal organelles complex 2 subunit 1 n=1 Tax=Cyprinus carpio carpio TaxID=630221 RepID=A0A9J8B2I2_CYPCA
MVHVYNCHPFASQHIVAAEQEPGLVCCGGGAVFVVSAGGCKIEAYELQREGCPLICRFSSMGSVLSIRHSAVGDYLVTIEEKNKATYLRAYTNWRYQAVEKTRVGVRLLGHLLRGSSFRGTPKEQMEIIEIPLFEPPLCMACCSLTGDLLVGCAKSLVVFSLKRQTLSEQLSVLDFERVLILHIQGWSPSQVAFCAGYVALQTELEVLVVKLTPQQKSSAAAEEHALLPEDIMTETSIDEDAEMTKDGFSPLHAQEDFFLFPKHQEMLGNEAQECGISLVLEWTGMEAESRGDMSVVYVLFRRFAPDFFQGCSVEETRLHSLQLHPMFTGKQKEASDSKRGEPTCVFVFFSLPNTGYMYSLKNTVELVSTYQYPEKAHQAVLSDQFLYIITRNALQCFTVRCSAVAARVDDPYIDTTMKDMADKVLEIFSVAEPAQLPHVVSSPSMLNADPYSAMTHLRQLEASGAPSITLSLCVASQALRKGDLHTYRQQMDRHAEMLQVYGFIEEPKLLLHGRGKGVLPTILAQHLHDTHEGLLVAAVVALHENSKIRLEEADLFFQELCKDGAEADSSPQLLVDFWEALLVASSHEAIIQELLFRLTSVYIDRITRRDRSGVKALKTAEDLINSCSHYGMLYPWVSILTPVQFNITHDHQEDLHKLQSLLCGPTLEVSSILPLLEQLTDSDRTGLSVHVLCATKLGQHETSIDRLLDRCPEAIIPYANHELQNDKLSLWWQKLFPEVCDRIRTAGNDNTVLLSALKETLVVAAKELNPLDFLDLLPDDGTAHFFLPHLLECSQ